MSESNDAKELEKIEKIVEEQEKEFSGRYGGELHKRLLYVIRNYQAATRDSLAASKAVRDDVLTYLRAIALIVQSVGNSSTHREKDARVRGLVEILESAIKTLVNQDFKLTSSWHSRGDIFKCDYPVREYHQQIYQLQQQVEQLGTKLGLPKEEIKERKEGKYYPSREESYF